MYTEYTNYKQIIRVTQYYSKLLGTLNVVFQLRVWPTLVFIHFDLVYRPVFPSIAPQSAGTSVIVNWLYINVYCTSTTCSTSLKAWLALQINQSFQQVFFFKTKTCFISNNYQPYNQEWIHSVQIIENFLFILSCS